MKIPFAYLYRTLTFGFHTATNQKSAPFILFGENESRDDFFHENQRSGFRIDVFPRTALGVEPSCVLPRARFQPWKHLDLFAELSDYDPHRYMSLQSRLALWGLNGNGNGHHFADHDVLTEQWRKGNPKPLEENLALILESIHGILNRVAPYFVEARNHYH